MSTRSVIAKPAGDGFAGRYCHWDGYPTCRGAQVWQTVKEFDGDVEAAIAYCLREETPGYWSSFRPPAELAETELIPDKVECDLCKGTGIRDDWSKFGDTPGCNGCGGSVGNAGVAKVGTGRAENFRKPEGYVTGNGDSWIESHGDDCGTEWAYVLAPHALFVFERRFGKPGEDQGHGVGMFGFGASDTESGGYWAPNGEFPWNGDEPNWEAVEGIEQEVTG